MSDRHHNMVYGVITPENPVHGILLNAWTDHQQFHQARDQKLNETIKQLGLNEHGFVAEDLGLIGEGEPGDPILGIVVTGTEETMERLKAQFGKDFSYTEGLFGRTFVGQWKATSKLTLQVQQIWQDWTLGNRRRGEFFYNALVDAYNHTKPAEVFVRAGLKPGEDADADAYFSLASLGFRGLNDGRILVALNTVALPYMAQLVQGIKADALAPWDAYRLFAENDQQEFEKQSGGISSPTKTTAGSTSGGVKTSNK